MSLRKTGIQRDRAVIARDRVIVPLAFLQRIAAVVVGVGGGGPERNGPVVTGNRGVELPEFLKRVATVGVKVRVVGKGIDDLADVIERLGKISGFISNHA